MRLLLIFLTVMFFSGCSLHQPTAAIPEASLDTMIGQMLLVGFRGTGLDDTAQDRQEIENLIASIEKGHVGGVILFERDSITKKHGRNIVSHSQLAALTSRLQQAALRSPLKAPLFISLDEEGGKVQRLKPEYGFHDDPSPAALGKLPPKASYAAGHTMGQELRSVGVNVTFAPPVDLNSNPQSPAIGLLERSFGADPKAVTSRAGMFAKGLGDTGVLGSLKHFPGHGSATNDTHLGVTDITATWSENELVPYKELLQKGYKGMVMVGHLQNRNIDPHAPASLSAPTLDILRKKFGWQGVIITDDLQMGAIRKQYTMEESLRLAILAGVDILLLGNNMAHDSQLAEKAFLAIQKMVLTNKISQERIEESYVRIMRLKQSLPSIY